MRTILLAAFLWLAALPAFAADAAKESVFDRVIRTGTIRCGYFQWPPFFTKDPNTGKLGGVDYDLIEEIGKQLSLKIDWAEEVSFDSMFAGFGSGRYDMICGPIAPSPARARVSDFTIPLAYIGVDLYVRAGDNRFDADRSAINNPSVRIAGLDGEFSGLIAAEDYPKARYIAVPHLSDASQLLLTVATGKADVTATDPITAGAYMAHNPGQLKQLPGPPARILAGTYAITVGEEKFKAMLNIASQSLLDTGFVERTLKKYPAADKALLRIPKPYELSK